MDFLKNPKIFLAIMLLIAVHISSCSKKEETVSKAQKPEEKMSQEKLLEIKQGVYSFKVEGFGKDRKVRWGLEGESANVVLDEININKLQAVYYGDDMTLTLSADNAIYNKKTQDIELKDNIIGRTSDGGEIITDRAYWNARTEEITTDSYVVVKRENITCQGKGLITKPRLKWVTFRTEIEVKITPDKKITCSGPFEIDHDKNMAIFNNNVEIVDKDSETFADRLIVYLNPDTNKIERVVTEGNVKVVHRGDVEDVGKIF